MIFRTILTISALFTASTSALAQQGYEFEVYGTSIPAPRETEVELHTNFVPSGSQLVDEPEGRATHRAFRSSAELTRGLTSWLAASIYAVGYARNGAGVGNRSAQLESSAGSRPVAGSRLCAGRIRRA